MAPVILFLIDAYLIPQVFLLPLLLIMTLGFLALRLPAVPIAGWALVYVALVLWVSFHPIENTQTRPYLKPYVRTAFILTGGIMACLLASHRVRLQQSNRALFKIVSALPSPVVVSDISGSIVLMNQAAERLIEGQLNKLSGLSFFATFVGSEKQGQEIAKYVGYFQGDEAGPFSTTLQIRNERPMTLHVTITIITLDKTRYAITLVEKVEQQLQDALA